MTDDPRIPPLLERWQEAHRQGALITVEDLCRDSPELADELRRRINPVGQVETHVHSPTSPSDSPQAHTEVGGQLGGFRLVRELGRGGMGVVFEAEDSTLHRRVAVKVLHADQADTSYRERFIREARAAAALRHDHVVTIFQVGEDHSTPFLVMEYLEGESLADRLDKQMWLPVPEAVRVAREVAEGLAAAHAKGLVHRDVKPANIWLEAPKGRVKLLDFGLARSTEGSPLTAQGVVAGTIGYMAPEQIYAGQLDGRTDLYALGCVLYQMLWGQMPFQQPNTMALLDAVVNQDAPNLDAVAKTLPAPLATLLRQLLARNPDDRPAGATEAAQTLREIENGLDLHGKPASPGTRTLQTGERRRTLGMWAGAAVVVLSAAIGIVALFIRFSDRPRTTIPNDAATGPVVPTGEPIRIGIIHSLSGRSKDSERPMYEAIKLAAEEINTSGGGVLGRPIELIHRDPGSIDEEYARLAEQLVTQDKVAVLFGCWSSLSRTLVGEVAARHNNLLIYSSLGEGLEQHANIVYVGGAPNQQLHEAANWSVTLPQLRRRRAFLVGSDYGIYSRAAHEILKGELKHLGSEVVGDEYVANMGDFGPTAKKVLETKADVIFNTVDGPSNQNFSGALRAAGITPQTVPAIWLGIGEEEMGVLDLRGLVGDFCVTPYFESIPSPENQAFVKRFKSRYPARARISDATEADYCGVYLWKQAVEKAKSTEPLLVRDAFRGQIFVGPEGEIKIDPANLYAWRRSRIGQLQKTGEENPLYQFQVLRGTEQPLAPEPFPATKTRPAWEQFLAEQRKLWGGRLSRPPVERGKAP